MRDDSGFFLGSQAISRRERLYDQAARLADFGAWECDLATETLFWTDGVYKIFDLPIGCRLRRSNIVDLYIDESRAEMSFMRAEAIRSGQGFTLDTRIRTLRGESRWMRLSVDVAYEDGRAVRVFGAKQNVTREKEAWALLRHRAERDHLTGLANRGTFEARYREVVRDQVHHGFVSALALIDLDHFKRINDQLGHSAGDECLRQVAVRLQHVFRDVDLIARIGGDEFAVLLRGPLGIEQVAEVLECASSALRKPILWNNYRLDACASIGARIVSRPKGRPLKELFADADEALYAAKAAGRDTVRIFDAPAHRALIPARVTASHRPPALSKLSPTGDDAKSFYVLKRLPE